MVLLGVLKSTVSDGEGCGMVELSKADLLGLPVLDVRRLDATQRRAIRDTFVRWEAGTEGAQDTLDG